MIKTIADFPLEAGVPGTDLKCRIGIYKDTLTLSDGKNEFNYGLPDGVKKVRLILKAV